jgi:hypothetical protein
MRCVQSDINNLILCQVPLPSQHQLREVLNNLPQDSPVPEGALATYDAPLLASLVKLWLLELDPPLALWDGWDTIKSLYPSGELVQSCSLLEIEPI